MNTLAIRNNSQMLLMVSGTFEISDMEAFALEFDGLLLTYVAKSTPTEVSAHECSCYNFHPAIASNTIHHKAWSKSSSSSYD